MVFKLQDAVYWLRESMVMFSSCSFLQENVLVRTDIQIITASKGFKYFEIANEFYLQNTPPLEVDGDIHFTSQRRIQGLYHWDSGYKLGAKGRSFKVLLFHHPRTHYLHVFPGQQGGVHPLLLYAWLWWGANPWQHHLTGLTETTTKTHGEPVGVTEQPFLPPPFSLSLR